MNRLKVAVYAAAVLVFTMCAFLFDNEVFNGHLRNDPLDWNFLSKGIFCALALYLWVRVLAALSQR